MLILSHEKDGDVSINSVRQTIKERFMVDFVKVPVMQHALLEHDLSIEQLICLVNVNLRPFLIGNMPVDGKSLLFLINELLSQIREGKNQFNMVSATEAMVLKQSVLGLNN